ncbi:hypothetical protein GGI25_000560 [Coemansia spiralis]|uniref:Small acidic protein n=2 Tax=Coemansia TaxID=4863 RepID=A0A9W8L184_9FUNG|nr:hypothetical protein BX070DRAFT_228531 [Coemansia spiralis]KAJ1996021.1 hypothetical protein EDC05_000389 [Coemansia umbellata]KAJ2625464.1 hypothetical protein GGI26_000604 [Coemansia sp. RSA 1358]KAJ2680587.1 hypothetical protein GGI25_000560 [Coemansia spiralis]
MVKPEKRSSKKDWSEKEPKEKKAKKHNKKEQRSKVKDSTKFKRKDKKKDKTKKEKKHNDKKSSNESASQPVTADALPGSSGSGWNNWAAAEFQSEERKNKFLRFMGIKSSESSINASATQGQPKKTSSQFASAISKDYAAKVQQDLEKQFSTGVAMRQQSQRGSRGGIGS